MVKKEETQDTVIQFFESLARTGKFHNGKDTVLYLPGKVLKGIYFTVLGGEIDIAKATPQQYVDINKKIADYTLRVLRADNLSLTEEEISFKQSFSGKTVKEQFNKFACLEHIEE